MRWPLVPSRLQLQLAQERFKIGGWVSSNPKKFYWMGIPALVMAQLGVAIASSLPQRWLLVGLGCLMLVNIYLFQLRKQLSHSQSSQHHAHACTIKRANRDIGWANGRFIWGRGRCDYGAATVAVTTRTH